MEMISLKSLLLALAIAVIGGCSNSESNNSKQEQVKTQYQWLEGDWKGNLFFHAEDKSFPAELKYHNGKIEIMFKEYCQGEANFTKQDKYAIYIQCKNGATIQLIPVDLECQSCNIILNDIDKNKTFQLINIQYHEKEKFSGLLEKK